MKTTPDHNQEPEQKLNSSPESISAERLGQTFAQEWAKIEKNQIFWRWAICIGVLVFVLCGSYVAAACVEKWQKTLDHFGAIQTGDQNATLAAHEIHLDLIEQIQKLENEKLALEFGIRSAEQYHSELRQACERIIEMQPGKPVEWPPEMKQARFELSRVLGLLKLHQAQPSASTH